MGSGAGRDQFKGGLIVMKKLCALTGAIFLVGCGGGGGGGDGLSDEPVADSGGCQSGSNPAITYTTSQPLADNSSASAYKVLLMGNSHAAGLRPTLENLTHVILQGQRYSSTGSTTYPLGATPIMFPEHPRKDNTWEGQTLWDLHSGIAVRENVCVAPVGPVWDEVIFRDSTLVLHQSDGNFNPGAPSI
jgi:hypothetical protein